MLGIAFAYTDEPTPLAYELIPELQNKIEVPFDFTLKKVTKSKSGLLVSTDISELKYKWLDYQPNNLAWPLMSEKMKTLIEQNLTGEEGIVWMKVIIKADLERRLYFIPRFKQKLDVLDENKTKFVKNTNHIIFPFFSADKIKKFSIFHTPSDFCEITLDLFIDEKIKDQLMKEKITGVDLKKYS
jgi:hypothetical protein